MVKLLKEQFYTLSIYLRYLIGTLVIFLIVRYLSVHDYGLFSSYKSIAGFCLLFANLEFNNYILVSSKANIRKIKLYLSLFLLNSFILIILATVGSFFFDIENRTLFFLVLLKCFFDGTFFSLILPYFQASKKFTEIAKINIIYGVCIACIVIISYIFKFSLMEFLIFNVLAGLINFRQCSRFIKIKYFFNLKIIRKQIKQLDKSIFNYIFSSLTSYLYVQIPSLYTAVYLAKEQAALFFAALTVSQFTYLFADAQAQKILPEMINKSSKEQKNILFKNSLFVWFVYIVVIIFFVLYGKNFLKLIYLKQYYMNAYFCLIICSVSSFMVATSALFGTYITAINKQSLKVKIKIETSFVAVISIMFLHSKGINGIALALCLSSFYSAVRYMVFSINDIKRRSLCNE